MSFFPQKKIEDIHLIKYLKKLFDVTSNLETAVSILNYKINNYKKSKPKAKKLKQKIKFKIEKRLLRNFFMIKENIYYSKPYLDNSDLNCLKLFLNQIFYARPK